LKITQLLIALAILSSAACGSEDAFNCRQACARLESCNPDIQGDDCQHDCQVIRQVALDQSWVEMGTCLLEESCEEADLESCLNRVALTAPEQDFELTLKRVCNRVEGCELGITHKSCMTLIKKYGGKRIKQARMLKRRVLDCLGDCVVETPCSQIVDSVDPCLDSCGVRFRTVNLEQDQD